MLEVGAGRVGVCGLELARYDIHNQICGIQTGIEFVSLVLEVSLSLARLTAVHAPPLFQDEETIQRLEDFNPRLVNHANHSESLAGKRPKQFHERKGCLRIESGCRLVEDQDLRCGDELQGDTDSFAFAPGNDSVLEGTDDAVLDLCEAEPVYQRFDFVVDCCVVESAAEPDAC